MAKVEAMRQGSKEAKRGRKQRKQSKLRKHRRARARRCEGVGTCGVAEERDRAETQRAGRFAEEKELFADEAVGRALGVDENADNLSGIVDAQRRSAGAGSLGGTGMVENFVGSVEMEDVGVRNGVGIIKGAGNSSNRVDGASQRAGWTGTRRIKDGENSADCAKKGVRTGRRGDTTGDGADGVDVVERGAVARLRSEERRVGKEC